MTATILTNLCIKISFFIEIEFKESDKTFESVKHRNFCHPRLITVQSVES